MSSIEKLPQHAAYVLIDKASELTGYSRLAIERKISRGVWVEGREWVKSPDGHRMISMEGYRRWVEMGQGSRSARRRSASPSPSTDGISATP